MWEKIYIPIQYCYHVRNVFSIYNKSKHSVYSELMGNAVCHGMIKKEKENKNQSNGGMRGHDPLLTSSHRRR